MLSCSARYFPAAPSSHRIPRRTRRIAPVRSTPKDNMSIQEYIEEHGLGKKVTILVFAEGDAAKAAEDAGADIIADDEIIARIQNEGWLDFDAAVAVPQMMGKVGRIARILGPRGLMPNPKAGTVVQPDDIGRVIEELKAGRVEFRNDKTANLHFPVGKASFDLEKLQENAQTAFDAVKAQEPSSLKGVYIRKMVVTSTMGPGVRVSA